MRGRDRLPRLPPVALLLAVLVVACDGAPARAPDALQQDARPAAAEAATADAAESPESGGLLRVAVSVADSDERSAIEAVLGSTSGLELVPVAADADVELSDRPLVGGIIYVIATWAVVTDQRRDVIELGVDDVRRVLSGEVGDWSQLGGTQLPISVYLPAQDADRIAAALGVPGRLLQGGLEPASSIPELVTARPGGFALLPVTALRPGIQALVVDGYDPYRDPAGASPLRLLRWVRAPDADTGREIAQLAGLLTAGVELDPVGVLATGELIPVRCTNEVLESIGDAGAMFDATRVLLRGADLTVMPLEVALTDLGPPTPCIRTFVLQGRPEVVHAMAEAGIDVVITAGNHAMDCWGGCPPGEALLDTLARLDRAGLAHAGAGRDLEAARTPAIVERGGVRFAFLGYDSIAPWYAATAGTPGTAPLDMATLAEDVARAKAQADHVVVSFGWGQEYTADPTPEQRQAAEIAVSAGASLVLGNHPHWVQAVELLDGAVVVYALGNFVFDQAWSVPTTQGAVLEAGFTRDRLLGFRLRPLVIRDRYRPELVDPAGEGAPILQRVWEATDRLPTRDRGDP